LQGGQIRSGNGFRTDSRGNVVVTKLNPDALQTLARNNGGQYFEINESRNDIARLINTINTIEGELMEARFVDASANKYSYFLLAALILLLLDVLLHVKTFRI
jgi:Ca-activated chloride channel family protein